MLPKAERMKLFLERASGNLGGLPIFSGAVTLPLIPVGRRTASGRQGRGRKVRTPEGAMPRNFAPAPCVKTKIYAGGRRKPSDGQCHRK
jgi:hypothetical protein